MVAALALVAGCGGGSSNRSANTRSVPTVSQSPKEGGVVSAKEGEFRAVIPRGYVDNPSVAQYWVRGREEDGFRPSLIVVREPAGRGSINTLARREFLAFQRVTRKLSQLEAVSVDGVPGFAVDYFVSGTGTAQGKEMHIRQVLLKRGSWLYFIRAIALPAQYTASVSALDEVIRSWQWQ